METTKPSILFFKILGDQGTLSRREWVSLGQAGWGQVEGWPTVPSQPGLRSKRGHTGGWTVGAMTSHRYSWHPGPCLGSPGVCALTVWPLPTSPFLPPSLPGNHPSGALASQDGARGTPAPRPSLGKLAEADRLPPGSPRVPCGLQTAGLASHARPSFPRPQPHLVLSPGSLPPAHKRPNISDGHAPCRRDLVSPFNCVFMKNAFEHRLARCPLCLSLSPGLP